MHRSSVVAATLGVDLRTVDQLVRIAGSKHRPSGARGRARMLPDDVIELFAVALLVRRDLGCPLKRAVELAEALLAADGATVALGSLFHLHVDRERLRRVARQALADATATVELPRRGRPPRNARRGAPPGAPRPV